MRKSSGFTLIELLVVVVIIGILASVAVPNFMGAQDKAKNAGVQANAHSCQMALEQFGVDQAGVYPADNTVFTTKVIKDAAYMAGVNYPKTPWGQQQAAGIAAVEAAAQNASPGAGKNQVPAAVTDYGAIAYVVPAAATAADQYIITGTGKKAGNAIYVSVLKNN